MLPEVYSEEERKAVEEHIKACFGAFETVLHEVVSPDIHVDVCVIPPAKDRNYYTLVTMGMGAHRMNVPGTARKRRLRSRGKSHRPLQRNFRTIDSIVGTGRIKIGRASCRERV